MIPASVERLLGHWCHAPHRPPEDALALHEDGRPAQVLVVDVDPAVPLGDDVPLGTVRAPDGRPDPGGVGRSDDGGAGAVGEDEGGAPVVLVGEVGEPLDADDQDVLGASAADHVVGQRDAVAVAGAGGRDVECRRIRGAEAMREERSGRGRLVRVAHRRDDDGADLLRSDAGHGQGVPAGGLGHLDDALALTGEAALDDPGALADPLVGGVDRVDDLGVGDDPARPVGADSPDAGMPSALGRGDRDRRHRQPSGQPSRGCRRSRGWPGETGSPSSTSHSTTRPPCGAETS